MLFCHPDEACTHSKRLILSSAERCTKMSYTTKISRTANAPATQPDETEISVAQALLDLESVGDLRAELRPLQISAAKEVDVKGGKKAIVVFVPVPQLKQFRRVQARCVPPFRYDSGNH